MSRSLPAVPWHVTGNHWVTLPCIHPGDASIHAIGAVHAVSRGAIEFAGNRDFLDGGDTPLIRIVLEIGGARAALGADGIAWERESGWIPTFSTRVGGLVVRGTICAPHGRDADVAGAVIGLSIENRGDASLEIRVGIEGSLGHRQIRVRTPREFTDGHAVTAVNDSIVLEGLSPQSPMAIAIGAEGETGPSARAAQRSWSIGRSVSLRSGESHEAFFHVAAGAERDSAESMLAVMRRRGGASLITATKAALREMEPATGSSAADRLIARHVFFCYFCSIARALDQSHWYVVRSRIPWNDEGLTIRDWHALMWVLPAVQLVDHSLAREMLLRICELHGYAPGSGVHYLDGSMFAPGFSLESASSFALAVDDYIVHTGDEKIVEEPVLADSLYGSHDDIEARRHKQFPLYSTEVNPDGTVPELPYTAHGNAVVALALEILRNTLDEKTSERVQDPAAVRAAVLRHFSDGAGSKSSMQSSTDLAGNSSAADNASASLYWLPFYDLVPRDDSTYRRTAKRLDAVEPAELELRCARLLGPGGAEAFDWLRRAPLDGGRAAARVDAEGKATGGGGDAALSGLVAHTVWYAVHALGLKV